MRSRTKEIKVIVVMAWGLWLMFFLIFAIPAIKTGGFAYIGAYGICNLGIFSAAWLLLSRKINTVLRHLNESIQSMIDGHPVQNFPVGEESLLGKFQTQLTKLYQMLKSLHESEERARRELSSLVADLVHQINTPLTNVQIYSGFLMQENLSGKEKEEICSIINCQIEKLGWFADGFIKTARLENDMRKLRPEKQSILPVILSAIDEISVRAENHGNEICLYGEQDIEAFFDSRWTEEAIFNLLDNAVKYGKEGSKIRIHMTLYEVYIRVDVINTGRLIPEKEYTRIFKRYYRGENAMCVKEGVGLGLYLTRQIMTEQGGYVKVSDYKGKGMQFSLFFLKNKV